MAPAARGVDPAMDRAAAAFSAGRTDEAAAICEAILQEEPRHFYALHLSGVIALQRARWEDAVAFATRALEVHAGHPEVLSNRGAALRRLGRYDEALADYDAVLRANPAAPDARHNRGVALAAMGRHDEAIAEYARALQAAPGFTEAFHNLGVSLAALNRHGEALHAHARALALDPRHMRARWHRALSLLALGRFREGFADYEARRALADARAAMRPAPGAEWSGREDVPGRTLLLLAEQGFGDTLLFVRFARLLHERGARVVLAAPRDLTDILRRLPFLSAVVAPDEPLPAHDYWCPLASVPARLGVALETLPAQEPALVPPAEALERWRKRLESVPHPRVGIAWAGGLGDGREDPRAMRIEQWQALRELPVTFVSLQKRVTPAEARRLDVSPAVIHLENEIADFSDTAALMAQLDLVITIDTSVAHLAGAMGLPAWILLPFAADWRWLLAREDSPWYPAARLFRSPRPGDWASVVDRVREALRARLDGSQTVDSPEAAKARARALLASGRVAEAEALARANAREPEPDAEWLHLLGAALHLGARHDEAIAHLERAAKHAPRDARLRNTLGAARMARGDLAGAEEAFDAALALEPADAEARFNRAILLQHRGDASRAVDEMRPLLGETQSDPRVLLAGASAHAAAGEPDGAARLARRALELAPGNEAVSERAADVLLACGRAAEAREHYAAVHAQKPRNGLLLGKLAAAYHAAGDAGRALELWRDQLRRDAGSRAAAQNLAVALHEAGERDEAKQVLQDAIARGHDDAEMLDALAGYKAMECDWDGLDELVARLRERVRTGGGRPAPPQGSIFYEGIDAATQRTWAERWCDARWPHPGERPRWKPHGRLRVGLLSGDLHAHATAWLLAGLVEAHDRERFEFVAYSHSVQDGTDVRVRLERSFDRFIEVGALDDRQAARRIEADGIDVLLDLGGHTRSGRLGILAARPAPIQGHFLGYPGTTGARFVDFFVADALAAPAQLEPGFTERVLRVPGCYQPNDRSRPAPSDSSRESHGLPRRGFVFCSFNQPVKVTAGVFARWCRLLQAVAGSVLWLSALDARAEANLRRAAASSGIDPGRLVFAPRVGIAQHIARLRHADLAIDTFPCGSHTTASDMLWAGVPLVTTEGSTFASRVAASVLSAGGCPQWVFDDAGRAFEATLALARTPALLAQARSEACGAALSPLYDAKAHAEGLQSLLAAVAREGPAAFARGQPAGVQ